MPRFRDWQSPIAARVRALLVVVVAAAVVAASITGSGALSPWMSAGSPGLTGGSLQPPGEPGAPALAAAKKKGKGKKQHKDKNGKGKRKGNKPQDGKDQRGKQKGNPKDGRKGNTKGKSRNAKQPQGRAAAGDVAAAAGALSLAPVADARVSEARPTSNYGNSSQLLVDGGADPDVATYLRFDVAGVSGAVQQATLRLWVRPDGGTANGPEVRAVGTGWTEANLTWNTRPAASGGALDDKGRIDGGGWVEFNVTAAVRGNGPVAFALLPQTNDGAVFDSRETSNRPQLLVTSGGGTTPTPTPTPTPGPNPTPTPTPPPGGSNVSFPVRATFYYPWFPHAWKQGTIYPYTNYEPSLGYYDGGTEATIRQHIAAMQYGRISMAIASWWGIGHHTDARIPSLLSASSGSTFRWALYHEEEGSSDPSVSQIRADLTYIRDHYASDPNYARINGKFVVFVYNANDRDCGVSTRWEQANTVGAYVVLKVMPGFRNCADQPESWHQYAPAVAADGQAGFSYAISPGFWQEGQPVRLGRDLTRWRQNVRDMVASGAPWQLVTTFNEWGEGTPVESAVEWETASGYGAYLDALRDNGQPSG